MTAATTATTTPTKVASSPTAMSSRQKPVVQPGRAAGAAQPLGRDEPLLCLLEARIPQQEPDCCHGLDQSTRPASVTPTSRTSAAVGRTRVQPPPGRGGE